MQVRVDETYMFDHSNVLRVIMGIGYVAGKPYVVWSSKGSKSLNINDEDEFLSQHTKVIDYD